MSRDWRIASLVVIFVLVLLGVAQFTAAHRPEPVERVASAPPLLPPPPPQPELPPSEPSREVPTLVEAATDDIDRRASVLAGELATMWTRNPDQLVRVIDNA